MNRRDLLKGMGAGAGAVIAAAGAYALARGVRFPVPQAEPAAQPTRLDLLDPPIRIEGEAAYLQGAERRSDVLALEARCFAPRFAFVFQAERRMRVSLTLRNVSPRAILEVPSVVRMHSTRLTDVNRRIELELPPGRHRFDARVPFEDRFRFAVTGDTGGGSELAWCLRRAADLKADFLLHAGDFYYSPADFRSLTGVLDASPLPVYASIGNHDFHADGRLIHRRFTREIGPRNTAFVLGDTMVVNFDTAASTWPVDAGERERLFAAVRARRDEVAHWVLMTHRPLHDPRFEVGHEDNHALSAREVGWVAAQLKALMPEPVLLAGHIHYTAEHEEDGIHTYISGDGLGNRNLVSGRQIARILVGDKHPGREIEYRWAPLQMPAAAHCHDKGRSTLDLSGKAYPQGGFGTDCPA